MTKKVEPAELKPVLPSEKAFDLWASAQHAIGELSLTSIGKYKPLWMAWLSWCLQHDIAWDAVQSDHIQQFLQGAAPGKGATRRLAINPNKMSSYTRQRYWRLLRGVYFTAHKEKLVTHNPVLDVDEKDRPTISEVDRTSQVLEPFLFSKLSQVRTIEDLFPQKTEANWWYSRDRALMAVLVETGITVTELIALRGQDLVETSQGREMAHPHVQTLLEASTGAELEIDVMETSTNVGRSLPISKSMAPLLREWLSWRQRLLVERSALTGPLEHRERFMAEHGRDGPLFIARRARSGTDIFPLMDATSVYHTVSKALTRLREIDGQSKQTYIAKGPAVVRNSVIRQWIDTVGPSEAADRAGLKSPNSLRLRSNSPGTP